MSENICAHLNRRFDHSALAPEVTANTVEALCADALAFDFRTVAINPVWVSLAAGILDGSTTGVLSVAGFPLGASRTEIKVAEAVRAVGDGASEIDMVANIGWLISGEIARVETEIHALRQELPPDVVLKVIVEAPKLTEPLQIDATRAVVHGGAQFVKTSTGFFGGATPDQVATLVRAADGQIEVKASGGIRTLADCRTLLGLGATRLGSSSCVAIMHQLETSE
ncbi:MAG: deoxyribose-phosphate aldolase [candidate division Zixibacteria bacterium]|nr:deoxyribose-phosphate aldolase [candidate division Zixibacteria bacterium]